MKKNIGLQLSSVRIEFQKDLEGSLRKIGEVGYKGIEPWFPHEYPAPDELMAMLERNHLVLSSCHRPYHVLLNSLDDVIAYHKAIDVHDIVCQGVDAAFRETEDDLKTVAANIGMMAEKVKKAGLQLHYHNHIWEFEQTINGERFLEYLYRTVDKSVLNAEIDTFFVHKAGEDIVEFLKRYEDRITLLHIKDENKNPMYKQTAVGTGTIDWIPVFRYTETLPNLKWYLIEENCEEFPEFDEMKRSWDFVSNLKV